MDYTIGQVAKMFGVLPRTLARWEARSLIPAAKRQFIANWRVWTDEDVETIELVVKQRSQ